MLRTVRGVLRTITAVDPNLSTIRTDVEAEDIIAEHDPALSNALIKALGKRTYREVRGAGPLRNLPFLIAFLSLSLLYTAYLAGIVPLPTTTEHARNEESKKGTGQSWMSKFLERATLNNP